MCVFVSGWISRLLWRAHQSARSGHNLPNKVSIRSLLGLCKVTKVCWLYVIAEVHTVCLSSEDQQQYTHFTSVLSASSKDYHSYKRLYFLTQIKSTERKLSFFIQNKLRCLQEKCFTTISVGLEYNYREKT